MGRLSTTECTYLPIYLGSALSISVPQSPRKRCFSAYSLGIKGSTLHPNLVFGSIGQNVLSPILVMPILR